MTEEQTNMRKINIRSFTQNNLEGKPGTKQASLFIALGLIVVFAGVLGFMRYSNGYWAWASEEVRQSVLVENAVAAAGKLMLLPDNEEPLIATILDVEALKAEQAFYSNAQNGDQLLIFGNSLRAVIYSPERNMIVNVGPVQVPQEEVPISADTDTDALETLDTDPLTIDVRNGSGEAGAASVFADSLTADELYDVISTADAARTDYAQTVIVDQTNREKPTLIDAFITAVPNAALVTTLPEGEVESDADVIVILGTTLSTEEGEEVL